jgi:hypothetical protein
MCPHVVTLPESAGIVFGGGFPRKSTEAARRAAQRAIFRVQRELEQLIIDEGRAAIALCDRGTLDGLAYWPAAWPSFFNEVGTTPAQELVRYAAVIHLRTAAPSRYNHQNPLRTESALEASAIDLRIERAWQDHPHRVFVPPCDDFLGKVRQAVALIQAELPPCCRKEFVPSETDLVA